MNLAAIALGWCLLAQVPQTPGRHEPRLEPRAAPAAQIEDDVPDKSASPPADNALTAPQADADEHPREPAERPADADRGTTPLTDVPRQKLRPPEILVQALTPPAEGALAGKPVSLLAALSRTTDRQQQLRIARAYWRLATAQADYYWAIDYGDKLKRYTESQATAPEAQSARASARAEVCDAELAVGQAQQELADLIGTGGADELPLTTDRPHVGGYNMYFEEIFAQRAPPPRIRLIHRMLPIRRKAIDAHGEAILAAADALEATGEESQRTGQGMGAVLSALDQLKHERRLFAAAVRDYNWEIAEYLFNVAPLGTSDKTLVSKLIIVASQPSTQPAPSREGNRTFAPAEGDTSAQPTAPPSQPGTVQQRTAEYQSDDARPSDDAGLYAGLAQLEPPQRAEKLAGLLHWNRSLPDDAGQPTPLADCLRSAAPSSRRGLIAAYWRAREQTARYQALSEQSDQLDAMSAVAIGARDTPGMAEAGVRLQATRRSAQAAVLDAEAALVDAQFLLTQAVGRRLDEPWLLPETPPQAHHVREAAPRPAPRSAQVIDAHEARLRDLADAVIQADAARAALVTEAHKSPAAPSDQPLLLDHVVRAVAHQTHHTLAFLGGLTGYNLAVAEHALATLPPSVSGDELSRHLAVDRAPPDKS